MNRPSLRGVTLTTGLFALVALGALGCVTSPTDGTALPTPDASRTYQGYSISKGAAVVVQALNYKTNQWETIGSGTASNTVSVAENTAGNNPELFAFSVTARVATASNPNSLCRWLKSDPNCQTRTLDSINACNTAQVRVQVGGLNALTFTDQGDECIQQEIASGSTAVSAAIECASNNSPVIFLSPRQEACIF